MKHRVEVADDTPRSTTKTGPGHNQTVPQLALITEVTFRVDVDNKTSPFMNTPIQAHPNEPITNKSEHPMSLRLPPKGQNSTTIPIRGKVSPITIVTSPNRMAKRLGNTF
jgi:hypothetical protein